MAKHRKHKSRHGKRSSRGGRGFALNPGKMLGNVTEGFKPHTLRKVIPLGIGAIGGAAVTAYASGKFGLKNPFARIAIGIAAAGALGWGASKLSKGDGGAVFAGAMLSAGVEAIGAVHEMYTKKSMPALPPPPPAGAMPNVPAQMALPAPAAAMGDYGTNADTFSDDGTQGSLGELVF